MESVEGIRCVGKEGDRLINKLGFNAVHDNNMLSVLNTCYEGGKQTNIHFQCIAKNGSVTSDLDCGVPLESCEPFFKEHFRCFVDHTPFDYYNDTNINGTTNSTLAGEIVDSFSIILMIPILSIIAVVLLAAAYLFYKRSHSNTGYGTAHRLNSTKLEDAEAAQPLNQQENAVSSV